MPNTTSAPTRSSACTSACAPVTRTLPGLVTCARGASAAGAPLWAGTGAAAAPGAAGSAACAWSGRTGGWCAERAARSRGLGPGEQGLHARSGHRPGDQESLAELAAHLAQRDELPWLLDALGDDLEPEVPADLDHGPGQQRERGVVTEPGDERGIDLDDVQRELAQVGERGVAGPEVVDGQLHAQLVQAGQLLDDHLVLFDQDPLVDLDGERLGR